MGKCSFCNRNNPASATYCQECGAPLTTGPVPEIPPPAAPANPAAEPLPAPDSLEGQVIELLRSGRKIEAIKLHRQRMGTDLMHAKQAVEAIGQRYGIAAASGGGCAGMVLLLVGLPALAGLARWLMVG